MKWCRGVPHGNTVGVYVPLNGDGTAKLGEITDGAALARALDLAFRVAPYVVDKASNTIPVNRNGIPASTRALMEEEFFFIVEFG